MMRIFIGVFSIAAFGVPLASVAQAQDRPTVLVELFTSQGCSSCPPADKILEQLSHDPSLVVLGWHVDYWDYLGWKDELAIDDSSTRQYGYRERWDARSVYTPQVIVHGETQIVGSNGQEIASYIKMFADEIPTLNVDASLDGSELTIAMNALAQGLPAANVLLVRILPQIEVSISRGENSGSSISYVNIVEEVELLANWNSASEFRFSKSGLDGEQYAIIVQVQDYGPVLWAGYLR